MNKSQGFTFFELTFALFILILMLGPLIFLSGESRRGMGVNIEDMFAHCAAYELTEQVFSIPFSELPIGVIENDRIKDGVPIATGSHWLFCISDIGSLSRKIEISEFQKDGLLKYKKINVQIMWKPLEGAGSSRSLTQTTLYANENL
ncbi:hypothetical protein HYY75_05220 [bacterium]|nr:hypothetical protein [bacterium]